MARILIVEDQPADRELLSVLLSYQGYSILEAPDGVEGLALALSERPDLLITDILMPGMDGYQLARRVRGHPSLSKTRIMFYTATYLAEEVRRLAAGLGVSHLLTKPAEPEHILEVVSAALSSPLPARLPDPDGDDQQYLRLLTNTLHRKVEQLKSVGRARIEAEQALQESEQRFRSTFEQAAVGIAHVSTTGEWLRVNQRLCEIVGYTRAELLGGTFQDITYPADLDIDLRYMRQLLAGDIDTYTLEKRYIHKDGRLIWINLTVSLVRDVVGAPKYFISVIEDISEHKRTDSALRQSEARFAKAFHSNPVAMTITRTADGVVFDSNASYHNLLGFSRAEVVGRSASDLGIIAEPSQYAELVQCLRQQGAIYEYQTRLRTKSGQLRTVLISMEQIELDGEACILTILSDITERRVAHRVRGGPGIDQLIDNTSFAELMQGLSGWVMREQRSAISPGGAPDPRESPEVQQRRAETNCGAIAVVPLRYLDRTLGSLTAINSPEQHDFSDADIELMEAIAGQAAIVIVRANLHETLQQAIQLLMDRGAELLGGLLEFASVFGQRSVFTLRIPEQ